MSFETFMFKIFFGGKNKIEIFILQQVVDMIQQ